MFDWRKASIFLLAAALTACGGGGGGGGNNPPPVTPPSALSYPAPPVYTTGTAITALSPTVTGSVTGYAITPALPVGLSLNPTSGVISGTPTAAQAATTHTVTASNAGGNTTAMLSITVNPLAPTISYGSRGTYSFYVGTPVTAITPTIANAAGSTLTIDPALPAGLTFNATDGRITGTPTAPSRYQAYRVRIQNAGGFADANFAIRVNPVHFLDLGHVAITAVGYSGSRILSADAVGHVRLTDSQTGELLLKLVSDCGVGGLIVFCGDYTALAGNTVAVRQRGVWDVFDATAGAIVATLQEQDHTGFTQRWSLSSDGSYLLLQGTAGLRAVSRSGATLLSRAGAYENSIAFAAANEIRVAGGPAGAQVIETIALPGGGASNSASFVGAFHSWYPDGERFLTTAGNTVAVYSRQAAQLDLAVLSTTGRLAGLGNWFWTYTDAGRLDVYSIGGGNTPAYSETFGNQSDAFGSGTAIAVRRRVSGTVAIIDLGSGTPVRSNYAVQGGRIGSFAALSADNWVYGTERGVLMSDAVGSAARRYTYGTIASIAGSTTRVAIATHSGAILVYDGVTRTLEGEIALAANKIMLSADGGTLAVSPTEIYDDSPDRTLRVYSLATRTVIKEFTATYGTTGQTYPIDFTLSGSGGVVGQVLETQNFPSFNHSRRVVQLDDTVLWSDSPPNSRNALMQLSFDATRIAVPDGAAVANTGTNIYESGALVGTVVGFPAGWIDDSRLFVNRYASSGTYESGVYVTPTGQIIDNTPLGWTPRFQPLGGNSIYSPRANAIFDIFTGVRAWPPTPLFEQSSEGAVAGNYVWYHIASPYGVGVSSDPR